MRKVLLLNIDKSKICYTARCVSIVVNCKDDLSSFSLGALIGWCITKIDLNVLDVVIDLEPWSEC